MKKLFPTISVLVALSLLTLPAYGEDRKLPLEVAKSVQQRYNDMDSLRFTFNQDTRGEMTGRPRRGSGWAAFYKGDDRRRMRWDYTSPDRTVLYSDGIEFSMYFEKLQQLIVSPAEALNAELTYSFFTGTGDLQRDYHIEAADTDVQAEQRPEFSAIKLTPKTTQSQVQDIHLWVTEEFLIRRISIRDHFGTLTVLNLSDIQTDGLNHYSSQDLDALFSFTAPEGTEIIHQ